MKKTFKPDEVHYVNGAKYKLGKEMCEWGLLGTAAMIMVATIGNVIMQNSSKRYGPKDPEDNWVNRIFLVTKGHADNNTKTD